MMVYSFLSNKKSRWCIKYLNNVTKLFIKLSLVVVQGKNYEAPSEKWTNSDLLIQLANHNATRDT